MTTNNKLFARVGVSINRLARDIVVPPGRISDAHGCANVAEGTTAWMQEVEQRMEQLPRTPGAAAIVNGKRAITADTALRLGKYFGVSPQTWMGLQAEFDLRVAQRVIGAEVEKRVQRHAA